MALEYGGRLAQQSKEVVQREIGRYVPVSKLRYYFAVDTRYVLKKILLILFPFTHKVIYIQSSSFCIVRHITTLEIVISLLNCR